MGPYKVFLYGAVLLRVLKHPGFWNPFIPVLVPTMVVNKVLPHFILQFRLNYNNNKYIYSVIGHTAMIMINKIQYNMITNYKKIHLPNNQIIDKFLKSE